MNCSRCNTPFDGEKESNICPECGYQNEEVNEIKPKKKMKKSNKTIMLICVATLSAIVVRVLFDFAFSSNSNGSVDMPQINITSDSSSSNDLGFLNNVPAEYLDYVIVIADTVGDVAVGTESSGLSSANYHVLIIPEGVTSIAEDAFAETFYLAAIILPESLTNIGDGAFKDCFNIEYVGFSSTPITVGDNAFNGYFVRELPDDITVGNNSFNYLIYKGHQENEGFTIINGVLVAVDSKESHIVIPDNVTQLDSHLFYFNTNIESITLPEGLEAINSYAFYGAENLVDVNFPSTLKMIDSYAFSICPSIKSLKLNEGLETIAHEVFYGCNSLEELYIPSTLTNAYVDSFTHNNWYYEHFPYDDTFIVGDDILISSNTEYSIENIIVPNGVKHIATDVYITSDAIQTVIIPEGVETIRADAFNSYSPEITVTFEIPKSVTRIDGGLYATWFTDITNITIRCYENSYAHEYALEQGYEVILI